MPYLRQVFFHNMSQVYMTSASTVVEIKVCILVTCVFRPKGSAWHGQAPERQGSGLSDEGVKLSSSEEVDIHSLTEKHE